MATADDERIWVVSTRGGPDAACEITWHGTTWYAPVADMRATATDLLTCAAYAEMMMQLATSLGLDAQTISAFTTELLATTGRTMFGTPATLDLLPAGSTKRAEPIVLIRRDPASEWEGVVSAGEARQMAAAWFTVAEATESDMLVAQALEELPSADPVLTERLFTRLLELRTAA